MTHTNIYVTLLGGIASPLRGTLNANRLIRR